MEEVVIVGAARTPIGKFGGSLAGIPAHRLGSIVIAEALSRSGIGAECVDEVVMGNALQSAAGQGPARQASIGAGIGVRVPAFSLNEVCGSGLLSVAVAASRIRSLDAEVVVAGGMENMSAAPYALAKARWGYRMGDGALVDTMLSDALSDAFGSYHMGVTAENVAAAHGVLREEQDEFAVASQEKAQAAIAAGRFREEIVGVEVEEKKGSRVLVDDEHARPGVTLADLEKLRPAFKENGTVTAGNASGINDGAAALVLMSARKAEEKGIAPFARVVASGNAGVEPALMGLGPIEASRKVFARCGLSIDDMDLIEANEAFAAQAIAVGRELRWDPARVNVNGGAIALGHPVGASGARILVTLVYELARRRGRYGLATLCVGGGMGVAMIVERL